MSRRDEPNASYFSARYAERKRAAERQAPYRPSPCLRCSTTQAKGSLFCPEHKAEYEKLTAAAKAAGWTPETMQACEDFAQRTYWPPSVTK